MSTHQFNRKTEYKIQLKFIAGLSLTEQEETLHKAAKMACNGRAVPTHAIKAITNKPGRGTIIVQRPEHWAQQPITMES